MQFSVNRFLQELVSWKLGIIGQRSYQKWTLLADFKWTSMKSPQVSVISRGTKIKDELDLKVALESD